MVSTLEPRYFQLTTGHPGMSLDGGEVSGVEWPVKFMNTNLDSTDMFPAWIQASRWR